MESNNQRSAIEDMIEKMEEIQREVNTLDHSKMPSKDDYFSVDEQEASAANVIDSDLFDQIKGDKKFEMPTHENKSPLRRFLDEEDAENEAGDEYTVQSEVLDTPVEDIEDFRNENERDEIYRDLKNTVGKMAVKSIFLFLISAVSIYMFIAGFNPVLFAGKVDGIFYDIILLIINVLCISISLGIFIQGLGQLLKGRCDTDTLLALLAISLFTVRLIEMIKPDFIPHSLILEPFLPIGLYFNVQAKKKIASNIKNNFKMISMNGDKLTVTVPPSCEANNDLILETGVGVDVM